MRATLDITEQLLLEAMKVANIDTKTDVIKETLINLIQKEKIKNIKNYRGKVNLAINIDLLRKR